MIMAGDAAQKFVCYPISREAAVAGKSLINWIAEIRVDDQSMLEREDWNREGALEDFLPAFEGWAFEGLNIPEIISRNRGVYEFPMVDRDPLPAWTFKNITLAGDAAHPMYPIGSNGASQGILDARCLSYCLATQRSIPAALSLYEDERRPATSRVVLANRENGPERIMQLVRDRAPQGFDSIDDVVSREDREAVASQYKKIAGFDPQELNRRRSFSAAQAAKAPD
jgi:2-polyprenyl-6-methoxyphenol hydroxylase-like FAD-dependent oxidoreductase